MYSKAFRRYDRCVVRNRFFTSCCVSVEAPRIGRWCCARTRAGLAAARALLTDPAITMAEVARRLQVSPVTLYRHVPGGRSSLDAGGPDQRLSPL